MVEVSKNINLLPSLLDRLLDDEPDVSRERFLDRSQNLHGLKSAVTRDLETLLNTRQEALEELPAAFTEIKHSLLVYGLPDFTAKSLLSQQDRTLILRALEQTIALFEPRLTRVHVTLEPTREHEQALRFRIDALLQVEPVPEPVTFDAMLLNTQKYVVQGHD